MLLHFFFSFFSWEKKGKASREMDFRQRTHIDQKKEEQEEISKLFHVIYPVLIFLSLSLSRTSIHA